MSDGRIAVLSALIESLPETLVFALDRDYRYIVFNELHRREMATVWKADIKVGDRILDFVSLPPARESMAASFRRVLSGEAFKEIRRQDETDMIFECDWIPLRDRTGTVVSLLALIAELSRTQRSESLLRMSNRLLEESPHIVHLGGWEYDVQSKLITWTPEVYRIYGVGTDFDPSDLNRDIGFYAPSSAPIIEKAFRRAVETGEGYDLELEFVRADGSTIWVRTIGKAEMEAGKVFRVSGNIMEITDRRTAQLELAALNAKLENCVLERTAQLELANKNLKAFADTMTHDLKAPLRAIAGFSRMVVEDYESVLDPEGKRKLRVVYDNALKLDALISDLLRLSRIGNAGIDRTRIAMKEMAWAMFNEVADPEDLAAISLSIDDLPEAVGESALIRKVWGNLFSNAIKFSARQKRRAIEVYAERTESDTVYFVRDNGIGFNPKYAGTLFQLFRRLHEGNEYAGTGAGLAIVKRIVDLHGGRVGAEGAEGKGAVFWFSLPTAPDRRLP